MLIKAPRGTKDILPSDVCLWNDIEQKARKIFKIYGYREIRTPIFEQKELFTRSLGESSDIIQKQLLNLSANSQDKGSSLRPEATASIVRAYIEHTFHKKTKFVKLCYIGPMFRGERPQRGRLRQFHHIGAEAIGATNPFLDAEIISLAINLLTDLGIKNYTLKINNLGCYKDRKKLIEILRRLLKNRTSELCRNCQDRYNRNVLRIFDCKNNKCKKVVKDLKLDSKYLCRDCQDYFERVLEALKVLKIPYEVSHYLVRGLDYYTRTVFEIVHKDLGSQDAIGAGGRYDTLVRDLGGPDLGAVGFALGIERMILTMPQNEAPLSSIDAYVATIGREGQKEGLKIVDLMRKSGVSCDINYEEASLKSQMRSADRIKAKFVILLGDDEIAKGIVTLKDMILGTQEEIKQDSLVGVIKARL